MGQSLYIIGIDGGGTKTTAVLCALDGTILAEAQGGPSNFQIIGVEKASHVLLSLIETCCHSIGCSISQIGAIVAGLAGAGRPEDQIRMHQGLIELANTRNLSIETLAIESDARIALEGAFDGKPGVIVIAGTGSIVFGKDKRGKTYRSGGWGRLIGDDGSGYAIGREAFRAVAHTFDDKSKKTMLKKIFENTYGFNSPEKIIRALYKDNFDIAAAARVVIEAASKGDTAARKILDTAAAELTANIIITLKKMNTAGKERIKTPLAFIGSLVTGNQYYSRKIISLVKRSSSAISIHPPESSPVVGAALMAKRLLK